MKDTEHTVHSQCNIQNIAVVENCFGVSGQPLAKEGRILVGEGLLKKECRKRAKFRIFFLFNDILVYGRILILNRKYIKQRILPLAGLTVESLPDMEKIQNRWMIKSEKKSFVVSAPTFAEKKEWMRHIEDCAKLAELQTGRLSTMEHAAPWIPDKATDICMRCTKTKFSFLHRRHHCRKCGFVVCGVCSSQKLSIPTISKQPQKVCLLCYKMSLYNERKQQESIEQTEHSCSFVSDYELYSNDDLSDNTTDDDGETCDHWTYEEYDLPIIFWSTFQS
ncbi:pleckstrin homology domain-containing family F member 1-like [Protopterus annectens]|uniref:pleckstrin homology domain-containing family F member 1-like n=1 Tax=Protopterus annectens TaxID=7888 RepID=UPI001CFA80E1|nr:pleckstrin homology domain-containing family F member 1-like [Protopterus annectens]